MDKLAAINFGTLNSLVILLYTKLHLFFYELTVQGTVVHTVSKPVII